MREIDYQLTKSDYREFYVLACARRVWKFCLVMGAVLTGLNAWSDYCRCHYLTINAVLTEAMWGFGLAIGASLVVLLLNVLGAANIHRALKPVARGLTISWDEEVVHLRSDFYSATYPWSLIKRPIETKHVIGAYLTSVSPLLFPKSAMTDDEIGELRKHLQSDKHKAVEA